jgi:hypothetical protein
LTPNASRRHLFRTVSRRPSWSGGITVLRARARPLIPLSVAILATFGCATASRWDRAVADPAGAEFAALVDSEAARSLLTEVLVRGVAGSRLAARAAAVSSVDLGRATDPPPDRVPDQTRLRDLSQELSLDFAALTFARAIGADERSRAVQAVFHRAVDEGTATSEAMLRRPGAFPYTVLFAPSWMYRSHPGTGSDFGRQRRLLDRVGIAHRLIATAESGSVEDNAGVIAEAVRDAGRRREAVILVSASKSGAEVAFALTRLLEPDEATSVVTWLNVAGALHGSPLADAALRPPLSWIARSVFWVARWDWAGLASLATERSRRRLENARMPDSIAVVNLLAVPVSGSVGRELIFGYEILRPHGPNDGVVLLTDAVWPRGANIVMLGADHLVTSAQTDAHALALLRAVDFAVRLRGAAAASAPLR